MNLCGTKKRRRHKNRIQRICKFIIGICIIFIIGCAGSVFLNPMRKPKPQNAELIWEINGIVEYYETQKTEHVNENDEDLYIQNQSDNEKDSLEDNNIVSEEFNEIEAISEDLSNTIQESERETYLRDLINSAPLNPRNPDSSDLTALLDDLMPEIIEECEDTYEKVKACYNFLINNCSYSQTLKYTYEQDAYLLLTEFRGSCTYYAAAFHYMMCYIGLDDQIINGYRYINSGKSFHRWNEITIEGVPYVFDTQWEDALSNNNDKILYMRFCLTYEEAGAYYEF